MMPGELYEGTILEASVAENPGLIAHELGHSLNLDHDAERDNLMHPVIYSTSQKLSHRQCQIIRRAALTYRAGALRPAGVKISFSSATESG